MPPKTRGTKTAKASKENVGVVEKTTSKGVSKVSKPRKALADKTNSASDDNASTEIPKKAPKKGAQKIVQIEDKIDRPRRQRRLPNRFVGNQVLNNLSGRKELDTPKLVLDETKTRTKSESPNSSPYKTPQKESDSSLLSYRPKRVCRLPSKYNDHSVSPNKFIPVGCHASTPIIQSKTKIANAKTNDKPTSQKAVKQSKFTYLKAPQSSPRIVQKSPLKTQPSSIKQPVYKPNSDTNNNAKQRTLRAESNNAPKSPEKPSVKTTGQKLLEQSFSFRVLEDKKKTMKRDSSHLDVYEFTFDPNEEPPPQKKKRKKVVRKKPTKPKTVVLKSNYDKNLNKALAALKNVVSKKPPHVTMKTAAENVQNHPQNTQKPEKPPVEPKKSIEQNLAFMPNINHISIGIDDIAADIENMDHHEINYSPVTSPARAKSPQPSIRDHSIERPFHDPLNLQEEFSFFDEPPVASSSINMSVRRPHASPWRVQFEQLPIKWHSNTYVKANMTPAVESSFINFNDSKKKHVYTNMVADAQEELPEIVENHQPNLKQTSIIAFIREVAERSASKKKRARSVTPTKANSIFEDISNISVNTNGDTAYRTPRKTTRKEPAENSTPNELFGNELNNPDDKDNEHKDNSRGAKNSDNKSPSQSTHKKKNKDGTFFGFDESEDQENVSPVKIDNPRVRALRPRARAVLQEINATAGPTRAKLPLAAKTNIAANSEAVNKVFEEMKSAADASVFPEKNGENIATDVEQMDIAQESDEGGSVHLFEDIELVHHLKHTRKSYGKAAKKVTFQRTSNSDSESQMANAVHDPDSAEEDDLADLTFTVPDVQLKVKPKRKPKKKDNLSKKEKAELEAWAAGFNSMCEDIEDVPLLVE